MIYKNYELFIAITIPVPISLVTYHQSIPSPSNVLHLIEGNTLAETLYIVINASLSPRILNVVQYERSTILFYSSFWELKQELHNKIVWTRSKMFFCAYYFYRMIECNNIMINKFLLYKDTLQN